MKIETAKTISNGFAVLTGSAGIMTSFMAYLEVNAVVIGILISFSALVVHLFFQILYHRKLTIADELKFYVEKMEGKLNEDIQKLAVGINSLLKKR